MRTFKIIVFSALAVFHLTAIIIISVGRNNFDFLLNLFNKLDLMLYASYLGLALFATLILFEWFNKRKIETLKKKHEKEINELKAKLYDKKELEVVAEQPDTVSKDDSTTSTESPKDDKPNTSKND